MIFCAARPGQINSQRARNRDLVGPAFCLIGLSAGPDPGVLYGLMRRRRWLAVETLCVWMWMPSRAVGIVQSRSDRFGSGPVRMPACDRLLHRHAFVRDRP
jgi:hypothetical protein